MIVAATSALGSTVATLVLLVMVYARVAKKRLAWRSEPHCPVCHHLRSQCTCRWL